MNGEWYFGIVCVYCAHMQNNSYGTSQLPDDRFTKEVHSIQCVGVCVCEGGCLRKEQTTSSDQ